MAKPTDRELVDQARSGDAQAFGVLVRRHQKRIFRLAFHLVRSGAEAEDVTQETFVRAYQALDRFDGRSEPFTWLYRIAVNTILDGLKRRGRSPVRAVEDPEILARPGPTSISGPSADMEREEIAQITRAVLEDLPEIFRTVLVMREFEDMAYQDIADVLQISIGTVESRLFRARAKFKDKLLQMHPEFGQE